MTISSYNKKGGDEKADSLKAYEVVVDGPFMGTSPKKKTWRVVIKNAEGAALTTYNPTSYKRAVALGRQIASDRQIECHNKALP